MRFLRLIAAVFILGLFATACGSATTNNASDSGDAAPAALPPSSVGAVTENEQPTITLVNEGGSFEGHTPRGFPGFGTGLFAGDELNQNFPTNDGVQIWLTFELPTDISSVAGATLQSPFLTVRGNPFESLGDLQAAPVRYDTFGPEVVGSEPVGPAVTCPTPTDNNFTCEIGQAVNAEIEAGRERIQVQLRFEGISDPDGEQDMALFFISDSNTNEAGIFELVLR